MIGKQSDDLHPLQGAMPLLFEQPRAEHAGPALLKMRAGGETEGEMKNEKVEMPGFGKDGGFASNRSFPDPSSSPTASPSSGSDCGMVDCSKCGLRQPLRCGGAGNCEFENDTVLKKALKVSEGFDASMNLEVPEPFAVLKYAGIGESPDYDVDGGHCGFCGERLVKSSSEVMGVPGEHTEPLQRCTWSEAELFHECEVEEHGALKSLWMEELRKVAAGEEEGMKQGKVLEDLEMELLVREAHLEEQHLCLHQHRLASLSSPLPSGDVPPGELPKPVLQTYTVPLQQVKRDLAAWVPALEAEYRSLVGTGAILPTTDAELRKNPLYTTPWSRPLRCWFQQSRLQMARRLG